MAKQDDTGGREQPRVFLSYAREDFELVSFVADFLAPLPIPVFLDKRSIVPGQKWEDRIVDEVTTATHVYVFWSKHAAASKWVALETELAIDAGKIVIPVIVDGTPLDSRLSSFMGIDVRFVAGVNQGVLDVGVSISLVSKGRRVLGCVGVSVNELLSTPWTRRGETRPDGYEETDPRLVALAMYGALSITNTESP